MQFLREGQTLDKLNKVEKVKLDRHPLEVRDAIRDTYSKEGVASLHAVPGELERLKWAGIYPQKQGGDAFMMRLKVPGGVMSPEQARVVGQIAVDFARGPEPNPVFGDAFLDVTTRQDIQMHWFKMGEIPEIWRRLEEVGLTTTQACGDSSRNVLSCPVVGLDENEVIDAYPTAQAISDYFTDNREYANLPRKFKMSVTGCCEDCAQSEINDIGLVPARLEDGTVGFNVRAGGGLSDGPRLASDIDVFITEDQAVELTRGIAQVFGELGNRENRWMARMRYLVQELGPEGFRDALQARVNFELTPAGEDLTDHYRGDHTGVHCQKDGNYYVGLNVMVGRMGGEDFIEAARLAEEYGGEGGSIRLATDQNIVITGIPEERLDEFLAEPLLETYSPTPGPFSRGVVACTGSEFCRFAIVETKARAVRWAKEMDEKYANDGLEQDSIGMHFSGCSASCAQPQIADIGFRGETAKGPDSFVEGVDIGLGGSLGGDAAFIDWVDGARPTSAVPAALTALIERFKAERHEGEKFHEWSRRMENRGLRKTIKDAASGADFSEPDPWQTHGNEDGAPQGTDGTAGSPEIPGTKD
ncbi:nitrite/sulfite reductase [Rubrobacter aplysinae]|uniref:nitrite/sulfite reductase n=1 Tax=Rubrobacter aplysinae TaxID=909625 RepID=UPI000AC57EFF|nr:ferredoxin--nitrite reductase [Rubrobacter aplysinae]